MIGEEDEAEGAINRRHDEEGSVTWHVKTEEDAVGQLRHEAGAQRQTPRGRMTVQQPTPALHRQQTVEIHVDQRLHQMTTAEAG